MASKIRPVGDRVVVKPAAKEEITKSGIVIPDTAKEKPQEGTIIAVGAGKLIEKGDRQALEVKEGDQVLFAKYGGTEFKLDGEDCWSARVRHPAVRAISSAPSSALSTRTQ